MKTSTFIAAMLIASMCGTGAMAQNNQPNPPKEVIKIWDGNIPGAKHSAEWEEKAANQNNPGWITAVTTPTLDYYPAEGDGSKPAVIICPGGSYFNLTYMWEGIAQAQWLNSIGVSAFILKYRLPKDETMENRSIGPLMDAQQAMRYVRSKAKELGINENKIGIIGFSAGGHLASTLSTRYGEKVYDDKSGISARPDFSILVYPVISMDASLTEKGTKAGLIGGNASQATVELFSNDKQVNKNTPPTFMAHAINDKLVTYKNSTTYIEALNNAGVECELHLYSRGDHGLGVKDPIETQAFWHNDCERWLKMMGVIKTDNAQGSAAETAKTDIKAKDIWENHLKESHKVNTNKYVIKTKENVDELYLYRAIKKTEIANTEYNYLYKTVCYQNSGYVTVAFLSVKNEDGEVSSTLELYKYQDGKLLKDFSPISNPDFLTWSDKQIFTNNSGEIYIGPDGIEIKDAQYFKASDTDRDKYTTFYQWNGKNFEKR